MGPSTSVEILLATYQGELYVEEQIRSILNQSFKDFRLLVRDDGSSDTTLEKVQALAKKDARIVILPHTAKLGIKGSFEALMKSSQAQYLFFSDQDDVWDPLKLEIMIKEMKKEESLKGEAFPLLIHSDLWVVDRELQSKASSFWKQSKLNPLKMKRFSEHLLQNPVTGCSMMINRALAEISLPIPNEALLHDHWLALTASAMGKRIAITTPLVAYRQHGLNAVGAKPFKSLDYLKQGWIKFYKGKRTLTPYFDQASAFNNRYASKLSCRDREALKAFLSLPEAGCFKARYLLLKHHINKSGLLRNLGLLITSFEE